MSVISTVHVIFRGNAKEGLEFYHSVRGGRHRSGAVRRYRGQSPVPTPDRNHGLSLIESISNRLDIDTSDRGTTVTIVWTFPAPAHL